MQISQVQVTDVLAVLGIAGGVITVVRFWLDLHAERLRRQPIVIAHENRERQFHAGAEAWVTLAHLRNESDVPAFNLRFGVEYGGTRFPYRHSSDDPDEGNYQAVVRPGQRLPEEGPFAIAITSGDIWATAGVKGNLDAARAYWCRYENARGETWETRNPGDRSARLDVRRVRRVAKVEAREQAERELVRGTDWVAGRAVDALRAEQPQGQ